MAVLLTIHYHVNENSPHQSASWRLVPSAGVSASRIYNNIIVSNDSNEEDALLNSAHEDQHDVPSSEGSGGGPEGRSGGGSSSTHHHVKGGKMRHEAGGPSSGSKDIVLSTSGSKTKIIVRKHKGSSKRSALDHRRAMNQQRHHAREDKCACTANKPQVVPVYVPYCMPSSPYESLAAAGPDVPADHAASYFYQQPPNQESSQYHHIEEGSGDGEDQRSQVRRSSMIDGRRSFARFPHMSFPSHHSLLHEPVMSPYSPYHQLFQPSLSLQSAMDRSGTSGMFSPAARMDGRHVYPVDRADPPVVVPSSAVTSSTGPKLEPRSVADSATGSPKSPERIGELFQQSKRSGRKPVQDLEDSYRRDFEDHDSIEALSGGMFPSQPLDSAIDLINGFPFPFTSDSRDGHRMQEHHFEFGSTMPAIPPLLPLDIHALNDGSRLQESKENADRKEDASKDRGREVNRQSAGDDAETGSHSKDSKEKRSKTSSNKS